VSFGTRTENNVSHADLINQFQGKISSLEAVLYPPLGALSGGATGTAIAADASAFNT